MNFSTRNIITQKKRKLFIDCLFTNTGSAKPFNPNKRQTIHALRHEQSNLFSG